MVETACEPVVATATERMAGAEAAMAELHRAYASVAGRVPGRMTGTVMTW